MLLSESLKIYVCILIRFCFNVSAPMLESRLFAMNIFPETACKIEGSPCESSGKYVEAVLRLTVAKVGNKVKVAEWWSEARLSWNQFIPEDKITHFVTDRKIKEVSHLTVFPRYKKCEE